MRVFLIDFENVHSEGMTGVDHLTDDDEVVIFYSNNADSITFDILHKLMFCRSKLSYYKIKRGGKNALDFQLSCYLGYRIYKDPEAEFYIISKDTGYDFIMDFWECGYITATQPEIRRFSNIKTLLQWADLQKKQKEKALSTLEALAKEKPPKSSIAAKKTAKTVVEEVKDEMEDYTIAAGEIIASSKTSHELYIGMVKRFGQKRGREIYSRYKTDFAAKLKNEKLDKRKKAQ